MRVRYVVGRFLFLSSSVVLIFVDTKLFECCVAMISGLIMFFDFFPVSFQVRTHNDYSLSRPICTKETLPMGRRRERAPTDEDVQSMAQQKSRQQSRAQKSSAKLSQQPPRQADRPRQQQHQAGQLDSGWRCSTTTTGGCGAGAATNPGIGCTVITTGWPPYAMGGPVG